MEEIVDNAEAWPSLLAMPLGSAESFKKSLLFSKFDEQCLMNPYNTAIIFQGESINYHELFNQVNALVNYLQCLHVRKNTLVAILLPKSAYQVIAALGVLKSGAAYMPVNVNESAERKQALLMQGEVGVVLTIGSIIEKSPWLASYEVIALDIFFKKIRIPFSDNDIKSNDNCIGSAPSDLAYVLFTSGSTGTPKGVMISHENALNTINDINERFHVTSKDRLLALSALDFDLSVYDIFGLLSVGGALVIPTEEELVEPEQWLNLIEKYQITLWNTVPGFMEMLIHCIKLKNSKKDKKIIDSLRLVLLSGDWIRVHLPKDIRYYCPTAEIISLGGATEASIWSIAYPIPVDQIDSTWKSIPYGAALKDQAFYILKEDQNPVSDKEEGELYIGGKGVGLGYWHDCVNTKYHFIQHPMFGYLYRTGDKGRCLSNGNIEFLGRIGEQIKLRGFRIDLKAIESCVESIPGIMRSVAKIIKTPAGVDNLIAFIKCENIIDHLLSDDALYQLLLQKHLSYWQTIYNSVFASNEAPKDPYFNTAGWISSYSKGSIPEYQMRELFDSTVSRILSLNPQSVLEVGVGTGLILAKVAPQVLVYDAIDPSESAINYIEKNFKNESMYKHVQCLYGDLSQLSKDSFYDTIILNSVAQYFPDLSYFTRMLDQLIEKTAQGGSLFLGDIYNHDYIEDFHISVQLQHQSSEMLLFQFYELINQAINYESELFIHPGFFISYARQHPRITQVDIQLKSGLSHNEINGFRYDVILGIEKEMVNQLVPPVILDNKNLQTENFLREYLLSHQFESVIVNGLPNLRLFGLSCCSEFKKDEKLTVKDLRQAVYQDASLLKKAIDPYHCYELGKELGYKVSCVWSLEKYYFDVAFYKNQNPFAYWVNEKSSQLGYCSYYANTPLLRQFRKFMEDRIYQKLSEDLAPYMQPHEIIFVDDFPFTANGKVDHKALLLLVMMPAHGEKSYKGLSVLEEQLQNIFKKILKLKNINLSKGFIQLGGDSMMMLETVHEIEKHCHLKITIGELIANPSVHELAEFLARKKDATIQEPVIY